MVQFTFVCGQVNAGREAYVMQSDYLLSHDLVKQGFDMLAIREGFQNISLWYAMPYWLGEGEVVNYLMGEHGDMVIWKLECKL